MQERRAESWLELQELLFADSWNDELGLFRSSFAYRGGSDAAAGLSSGLVRLGGDTELERQLMRAFRKYARLDAVAHDTAWDWLALGQHHGLPTRLLDWSYSPLVAAHFATLGDAPADRVIWQLDWKRVHRQFGFPELALLIDDLHRLVGRDGRFTPWRMIGEGSHLKPFACMIEPPTLDARISAQSATFTLCSDTSKSLDQFLAEHGLADALTRFVVPQSARSMVRDQLDLVGMDERRLFPDLDGVAAQMRRYYS